MTSVFRDSDVAWAALIVVVLPLIIIGIGELEERLRQRDSPLEPAVSVLRTWVVPLVAARSLIQVLFSVGADNLIVRLLGTALVFAASASALMALGVLVAAIRDRPRAEGERSVPRLMLALPRLLVLLVTGWFLLAGVWDVDLSAALTALGVTSLVVSFALQDTLSGIASGFLLLSDQPFQPGDWILANDIEGRVLDVNWRSSRLQNRNGDLVVVPNGQLANATIINFDQPSRQHRIVVPLQVAFSNAPTSAIEMLLAAANATTGVLSDPSPAVRVVQIDDPLMGYEVDLWIDDYTIAPRVRSEFSGLVWYHTHRFDVPLPSPAQDLFLWDGPTAAIEGKPDRARMLRGVRQSTLLRELGETDLDHLASVSSLVRYARGETIVADGSENELSVLDVGSAAVVLRPAEGVDTHVLDIDPGDVFGILDRLPIENYKVVVVAVTDCDVVEMESGAALAVISRSPALTTALDQLSASRRRRVQRVVRRMAEERAVEDIVSASEFDGQAVMGAGSDATDTSSEIDVDEPS